MKKFLKLILSSSFLVAGASNSTACNSQTSFTYYDNRTLLQLHDAYYLMKDKLTLNSDKHVLLIGLDGIPFSNLPKSLIQNSVFRSQYWIENYETVYGWSSVLWGNILQNEANIFQLIKKNNNALQTANLTQWMGSWYYSQIYGNRSASSIDTNYDFANQQDISNYNTKAKLVSCLTQLINLGKEKIAQNYNLIFLYNAFFDELKHKEYYDNDPLILDLLNQYNEIVNNFYQTLDSSKWLVIVTTDHGRGGPNNFNHANSYESVHYSWTLANHNLNDILGHNYNNFYDIRTVALKWLARGTIKFNYY